MLTMLMQIHRLHSTMLCKQKEQDTAAKQTLHTAKAVTAVTKEYFDSIYLVGHRLTVTRP